MDKFKVLVVLLAISVAGNIYFILTFGDNQVSNGVSNPLVYAYHQAFHPSGNTSVNTTRDENATPDGNITPDEDFSQNESSTIMELLLQLEKEGALNESLLMMLIDMEEGNMSVGEEYVTPEPEPTPDPNAWKTYTTTKWRFSIPYPPSWEVKEGPSSNPAVTFSAPPEIECSAETTECYHYTASLVVSIDQNPSTTVLEDYFNKKVSALQKSLGITATSKSAPTTISGNKAYWIEYYTRDSRGNPLKRYMQYFTILDKKVYILTYSGPYSTAENVYSYYKPDAQKMIDCFIVDREYKIA